MFDLQSTAEAEGRQSEAKVWSVLVAQVWSGLVGYCWGTPDLKEVIGSAGLRLFVHLILCSIVSGLDSILLSAAFPATLWAA